MQLISAAPEVGCSSVRSKHSIPYSICIQKNVFDHNIDHNIFQCASW